MKSAGDIFGYAIGIADFGGPFRQRREHGAEIDFLKRLAIQHGLIGLPDEQDHRRGILKRGVHADGGIGGAGAARDEADAGFAGQLAVSLRHIGCTAFLAAGDQANDIARAIKRIEHGEIAFARHAKSVIGAVYFQRFDKRFTTGAGHSLLLPSRKNTWRHYSGATKAALRDYIATLRFSPTSGRVPVAAAVSIFTVAISVPGLSHNSASSGETSRRGCSGLPANPTTLLRTATTIP